MKHISETNLNITTKKQMVESKSSANQCHFQIPKINQLLDYHLFKKIAIVFQPLCDAILLRVMEGQSYEMSILQTEEKFHSNFIPGKSEIEIFVKSSNF